jgi:hypothetical protein
MDSKTLRRRRMFAKALAESGGFMVEACMSALEECEDDLDRAAVLLLEGAAPPPEELDNEPAPGPSTVTELASRVAAMLDACAETPSDAVVECLRLVDEWRKRRFAPLPLDEPLSEAVTKGAMGALQAQVSECAANLDPLTPEETVAGLAAAAALTALFPMLDLPPLLKTDQASIDVANLLVQGMKKAVLSQWGSEDQASSPDVCLALHTTLLEFAAATRAACTSQDACDLLVPVCCDVLGGFPRTKGRVALSSPLLASARTLQAGATEVVAAVFDRFASARTSIIEDALVSLRGSLTSPKARWVRSLFPAARLAVGPPSTDVSVQHQALAAVCTARLTSPPRLLPASALLFRLVQESASSGTAKALATELLQRVVGADTAAAVQEWRKCIAELCKDALAAASNPLVPGAALLLEAFAERGVAAARAASQPGMLKAASEAMVPLGNALAFGAAVQVVRASRAPLRPVPAQRASDDDERPPAQQALDWALDGSGAWPGVPERAGVFRE